MSSISSRLRQDLVTQFELAAISAAASVERVPFAAGSLAAAVSRIAIGRVAIAETLDLPSDLFADLRKLPVIVTDRSKEALAACDVGITEAFAGVARTGSVCVAVAHDYSGAISLLARMHIAVMSAEKITERPGDLLGKVCSATLSSSQAQAPQPTWVRWYAVCTGLTGCTSSSWSRACRTLQSLRLEQLRTRARNLPCSQPFA